MILSNKKIISERKNGNIIIEPFNKKNVCTSSYDVTLGENFYREQKPIKWKENLFNIYSQTSMERIFGRPMIATRADEVIIEYLGEGKEAIGKEESEGINPDDKVILIKPGETILCHTIEFIGGRNNITTSMQARSGIGRSFIEVCKCAGWGDVGYFNRWTMEITNNSKYHTIPLVVGRRIAQIIFLETYPIIGDDYSKTGDYQKDNDLEKLKVSWKPEMMLPRVYKDREAK